MKKKNGNRKLGRNKRKMDQYKARNTRLRNKIKRVMQSSGMAAALEYAHANKVADLGKVITNKHRSKPSKRVPAAKSSTQNRA